MHARPTRGAPCGKAIISVFEFDLGSFLLESAPQPITPGLRQAIIAGSANLRKFWKVL
jgi:hypothetical protein